MYNEVQYLDDWWKSGNTFSISGSDFMQSEMCHLFLDDLHSIFMQCFARDNQTI